MKRWMACAAVLAGTGCGAPQGQDASATDRLVAKVNGAEITMQQAATPRSTNPRHALERVIDQELLVQQALAERLDRDPAVVRALEHARREVLAKAWLERAAAERAASTAEEVREFYLANPALFAERRIYKLREIAVAAGRERLEQVRAEVAAARDLDEAAAWLRWRNLKVGPVSTATQAAEHLPLAWLAQLARMREGEIAVFAPSAAQPAGASVVELVQASEAPLSEAEAAPVIERFLAARKRLELEAEEVRRLRAAASIEYVGDFQR